MTRQLNTDCTKSAALKEQIEIIDRHIAELKEDKLKIGKQRAKALAEEHGLAKGDTVSYGKPTQWDAKVGEIVGFEYDPDPDLYWHYHVKIMVPTTNGKRRAQFATFKDVQKVTA